MKIALARIALMFAALIALSGCYVAPYYPYGSPPPPTFDRSWAAASGALRDQGAQITREDRSAGVIEGRVGDRSVNARVFTQADGSVRVEFNTSSTELANRISSAYEARMGR